MARWDRITREADGNEIVGLYHRAFIHNGGTYFLTEIKVYQDGMIDCWELVDVEGFKQKVEQGWVVTSLPEGAVVSITLLAQFAATKVLTGIKEVEFVKEIVDDIEFLNGRPTAAEKCLKAYEAFQAEPTKEARQRLRETYEAIPEHNRRFVLGDMDVKDIPIRMIICGEEEIENWSHRQVAKKMGIEPFPSIDVPGLPKNE
jgi:hypothetical protein